MPAGKVNGMTPDTGRGITNQIAQIVMGACSQREQRAQRRILRAVPGSITPARKLPESNISPRRTPRGEVSEFKVQSRTAGGLPSHSTGRTIRDTSRWRAGRGDQQKRSRHVHEPACAASFNFALHHLARSSDPAHAEIHILWILGRGQVV